MDLELRSLLQLARRWWWLLLLAPLAAGVTAYVVSARQPELYSASARLFVTPGQSSSGDYDSILAGQRLAETYRVLLLSQAVLERVVADLDLPYDVDELRDKVTSNAIEDTQLVDVAVSDTNPQRAAAIANAIGAGFVDFVGEQAVAQSELTRGSIDQQIAELEGQIAAIDERVVVLETSADPDAPAVQSQLADLRAARSRLQQTLADLQLTAREISVNLAATRSQVTVSNPASIPEAPYAPRTVLYTVLGALAGLLLAIGAVAFTEYLDNSVKPTTDFVKLSGSPLLATVASVPKVKPGPAQLFTLARAQSPAAEAMRLLRANIDFAAAVRPIKTLAITSAGPAEGKSTITANLGVVMAQAGLKTVIIDADLRRPTQHRIFNTRNDVGLTSLLTHTEQPWHWAAVQTDVPRLAVIPSGPIPPNPTDLLRLERMKERLAEIMTSADVVLLDTPPILAVSDALVVATNADGVMVVGVSGQTRLDALQHAVDSFGHGSIRLIGIVLNRQLGREGAGYYYGTVYGPEEAGRKGSPPPVPPPARPSTNGASTWPAASSPGPRATAPAQGRQPAPGPVEEQAGAAEAAGRRAAP